MGRFFSRCGPIAGPFPVCRVFDHLGANRIENHIATDFKQMQILLDKDGLVPALKKMSGLVVAFIACLSEAPRVTILVASIET
ncbi:hypothetical protein [Candidatus Hakubella thermalkaliphila]|uniref:Uncharacterized protein n=1 Tax=Candidatus Hakubella thermalkaliphila TaxID=2754717 RepID=A0A6V8QIW0_9ACTN|nr:hypothetical protein [Candidatus Hakubella thermalkaliphila]GFP27570.1 hypothetical protein HKBW3S33_00982 [Candidatus Hakubella thermalkaliphila]GFP43406.1 hypothetical protein HKBW3C_02536 [Candidatus Hakubella thermalkaliphila]